MVGFLGISVETVNGEQSYFTDIPRGRVGRHARVHSIGVGAPLPALEVVDEHAAEPLVWNRRRRSTMFADVPRCRIGTSRRTPRGGGAMDVGVGARHPRIQGPGFDP